MNDGALDRTTFEAIEAYVLDRMAPEVRAAFEQRLAAEPALRAEVELQRESMLAIELGGLERMLRQAGREAGAAAPEDSAGGAWRTYVRYAAVLALLIGAAWWALLPPANERLFAQHFEADPGLPVEMGATDDPVFAEAMVSYKEGRYADARTRWEQALHQHPGNDTLQYYAGSAALAGGDAEAAIAHLLPVANDEATVFRDRARWYLFLAYVRTGRAAEAKALHLQEHPVHGERARTILTAWP